jgi:hypothetical protein
MPQVVKGDLTPSVTHTVDTKDDSYIIGLSMGGVDGKVTVWTGLPDTPACLADTINLTLDAVFAELRAMELKQEENNEGQQGPTD